MEIMMTLLVLLALLSLGTGLIVAWIILWNVIHSSVEAYKERKAQKMRDSFYKVTARFDDGKK